MGPLTATQKSKANERFPPSPGQPGSGPQARSPHSTALRSCRSPKSNPISDIIAGRYSPPLSIRLFYGQASALLKVDQKEHKQGSLGSAGRGIISCRCRGCAQIKYKLYGYLIQRLVLEHKEGLRLLVKVGHLLYLSRDYLQQSFRFFLHLVTWFDLERISKWLAKSRPITFAGRHARLGLIGFVAI